jgi:hypothetical protein
MEGGDKIIGTTLATFRAVAVEGSGVIFFLQDGKPLQMTPFASPRIVVKFHLRLSC